MENFYLVIENSKKIMDNLFEETRMKYKFLTESLYYKYVLDNTLSEFYVIVAGYEQCKKEKGAIGPLVRSHFVIHYCLKGKGYFKIEGQEYEIKENDMFFIPVDTKIAYAPNQNDPWTYLWIEVNGSAAQTLFQKAGFTKDTPVFHDEDGKLKDIFCSLLENMDEISNDLIAIAKVNQLLFEIIRRRNNGKKEIQQETKTVVKRICAYINENYTRSTLNTSSIARHFFMNEAYLSRVFKQQTGFTITRYIYDIRMQKARLLLLSGRLNVQEVAYSVGFNDPLYFSKQFKKYSHLSPSKYKKK